MLSNGRWESPQFNSRLQPTQIALGSVQNGTDKLKLDYEYGEFYPGTGNTDFTKNNGNISKQTITVGSVGETPGFVATQYYAYDPLNRIQIATENVAPTGGSEEPSWRQHFKFDRYGNRTFVTDGSTPTSTLGACAADVCNPTISPNTNKITSTGYSFDAGGNTIRDAQDRKFTYDSENKQTKVESLSPGTQIITGKIGEYFYGGDGKRIKKRSYENGVLDEETIFVYDAAGKLIGEYSNQVAQENATVAYLTNDHLGSPRINTDINGNVTARHDYHPFGEEVESSNRIAGVGYAFDAIRKQFTGYERDKESMLEYADARYLNSLVGRFSTVDPTMASVSGQNPQTWNRYSYVMNNPLAYVDPLGLWAISFEEIWERDKDGSVKLDKNGNKILLGYFITAVKTDVDDDGAQLADQLGLSGTDAEQFSAMVGLADTVPLGEMLRSFKNEANEDLLKEISSFFDVIGKKLTNQYNSDRKRNSTNPDSQLANCAGVADTLAGGANGTRIQPSDFDDILENRYSPVDGGDKNLRIRDVIRYATDDGKKGVHFTSFIFRQDDGVPLVFSKSGDKGRYETGTAQGIADKHQPAYGSISGYYPRR